ncbi:hypothetical protein B0T26DRAFT_78271 [Lasiosphaeria miniovina]|uniref:Uncharacterized protein n=1 Tax=Lasiosphaeria miniovina TaxID=1954250 RepID=A0AA40BI46_9PEZI|nr:uncharacterized protein B0T26DRAFT_78271 [Lasiosphaeria miniovina]KAK0734655.1 hypothetical protein B0T26DRAFT_78271 [Lasiosphaeria miniovina]
MRYLEKRVDGSAKLRRRSKKQEGKERQINGVSKRETTQDWRAGGPGNEPGSVLINPGSICALALAPGHAGPNRLSLAFGIKVGPAATIGTKPVSCRLAPTAPTPSAGSVNQSAPISANSLFCPGSRAQPTCCLLDP